MHECDWISYECVFEDHWISNECVCVKAIGFNEFLHEGNWITNECVY